MRLFGKLFEEDPAVNDPAPPPDPTPEQPKPYWPEDWRNKMAGDDEKLMKRLDRFSSPQTLFNSYVEAQRRISSGELKPVLKDDAKPEELQEWRDAHGIPAEPKDYDLNFDNGIVIGDEDKEIVEGFLKTAHDSHFTPEQVKHALSWYYEQQDKELQEQNDIDERQRQETTDALNIEWGPEYRRNVNMVNTLLDKFPEEARDLLKGGRLSDGTGIFNNQDIMKGFADLARQLNPMGTQIPDDGENQMMAIEDEINSLEKLMREDRKTWNKSPEKHKRYQELVAYRDKMKK